MTVTEVNNTLNAIELLRQFRDGVSESNTPRGNLFRQWERFDNHAYTVKSLLIDKLFYEGVQP